MLMVNKVERSMKQPRCVVVHRRWSLKWISSFVDKYPSDQCVSGGNHVYAYGISKGLCIFTGMEWNE